MNLPTCDKCGKPVPENNDASIIEALATGNNVNLLVSSARHFLPTNECLGSPSRAQYIEGQQKDSRLQWQYDKRNEAMWRKAYRLAQEKYGGSVEKRGS